MSEQPGDVGSPDEQAPQGDQSELDLGVATTGEASVDAALKPLEQLADRPVSEHPEVFEQVHQRIDAAMSRAADVPSAPGPADAQGPVGENTPADQPNSRPEFQAKPEELDAD